MAIGAGSVGRAGSAVLLAAVTIAGLGAVSGDQRAVHRLANGVARTPPMGWNTWNSFGCTIDENLVRTTADAIVSTGMRDAGYQYVVVDDCWFDPDRDATGNLQASPSRFPSGMKALGDYVHAKGLKFGLYQVPASRTCAQYAGLYPGSTGSGGHELADARRFAAWGVDYLKYDWCSPDGSMDDQVVAFSRMRDALATTGRPIVFSINPNSIHASTGPLRDWSDVANLWRTTQDVTNVWDTAGSAGSAGSGGSPMGIANIVDVNLPLAGYAGPGGFNDPDMLEVGRGGLTDSEMRSHFALWAMMAAPLIAGNDVRSADPATRAILANPDLIAIDQDALGQQAEQVSGDADQAVLIKYLGNGDLALALVNRSASPRTITTTAWPAGRGQPAARAAASCRVTDAWTHTVTTGAGTITATVPAHGTAVYRVARVVG